MALSATFWRPKQSVLYKRRQVKPFAAIVAMSFFTAVASLQPPTMYGVYVIHQVEPPVLAEEVEDAAGGAEYDDDDGA